MNTLIVAVAQYALFVVAAVAAVVWLRADRPDKLGLAAQALLAAVLVAVMVKVAGVLHTDPRPFVQNPALTPMFAHSGDNGFPSDHTALATAISVVVLAYRRAIGSALLVISALIGVTRVLAHVHHWQDIGAGLAIGLIAAYAASALWRIVRPRLSRRPKLNRV